ncbi:MAG: hypothetical protein ABIK51_03370 [candidate division WOR-3 bacterium]
MSLLSAVLLLVRGLPLELAIAVARIFTLTYLFFRYDYRREIESNQRLLLGSQDRWFWLRNGWCIGRNLALMAKLGTPIGNKLIDSAVIYRENIDDGSVQTGDQSACIMVSFHFGVWEFLPGIYRCQGQDVAVTAGGMRDARFNVMVKRLRSKTGVKVINRAGMLIERLRRPGITGFMLDNTARGTQIQVVLDGVTFRIPALPFAFGRRCGCSVIPVFCYWDHGRLWVRVFEPDGPEGCIRALLQMVRERPAEWIFWGKAGAIS